MERQNFLFNCSIHLLIVSFWLSVNNQWIGTLIVLDFLPLMCLITVVYGMLNSHTTEVIFNFGFDFDMSTAF
ncbi:hypothetical protein I7I48_03639 [Histoplasma ohiense]|nr:hypothetical protein I7I48_03639 [Histoplasma ohiense (nom. inval.)]